MKLLVCSEIPNIPSFCVCAEVLLVLVLCSQTSVASISSSSLRIMMLSVLKNTRTPVKFWFLKNYLSPTFKVGFLRFYFSNRLFSKSRCEVSILRTHSSASLWFPNVKIFLRLTNPLKLEHTFNCSSPLTVKIQNLLLNIPLSLLFFLFLMLWLVFLTNRTSKIG